MSPDIEPLATTATRRSFGQDPMAVCTIVPRSKQRFARGIGGAIPLIQIGTIGRRIPGFKKWSGTTIGNEPIGQGISVTPIQMASVYGAVANGGVWIQPHLVDRVGGHAPQTWKKRRLMSPAVDKEVKTMLTGKVAELLK